MTQFYLHIIYTIIILGGGGYLGYKYGSRGKAAIDVLKKV